MNKKTDTPSNRSLEVTAIFGGIGGLEFGLHAAGHRTSLFCENDPEAAAVLARATGIGAVLFLPEQQRADGFHDFQRNIAYA